MKKITLLLLALVCFNSFSQIKLESAVDEFYDGTSWKNGQKYEYQYDANNSLVVNTSLVWNETASVWEELYEEAYSYNADDKVTELIYQDWNTNTSQFENTYKDEYTYNSNGQVIEQISYNWSNAQWGNSYRFSYNYINDILNVGIGSFWDGVGWSTQDRVTLSYNGSGFITEALFENYDWINQEWMNSSKEILSYNSNDKIIENLYQNWDGSVWVDAESSMYDFDANNNRIRETLSELGNSLYKDEYALDTNLLMSNFAHPFKDKTGLDYLFESYPYFNKLTNKNSFSFDSGSNTWIDNNRTTYNYDGVAGVDEFGLNKIKAYPNPSKGSITVSVENSTIDIINVYNTLGKKVYTSNLEQLNVQYFSNGVYIIEVRTSSGAVLRERIIKE